MFSEVSADKTCSVSELMLLSITLENNKDFLIDLIDKHELLDFVHDNLPNTHVLNVLLR